MAKLDLRSRSQWAELRAEREHKRWARRHGDGPPVPKCDECGADACYAQGDLLRDQSAVERFCERHAPAALKRPGDHPPFR